MLWNLTSLWSFSSTAWHLFKVQTEPFCFPDPIRSFLQNHSSPFPASLVHSPPCERGIKAMPPPGCPPLPGVAGPARPPEPPARVPARPESPFEGRRGGGEVPAAEEAECWVTPAPLSRKARRLSISRRLWQGPGRRSNPCVRADEPHYPMKYFIITTAVKYWWLLASAECFSRRLSLGVMEPNSSLYTVSDIWKLPKKSKGA